MAALEALCFEEARRDSLGILRRSLRHPRHEVWLFGASGEDPVAALVLRPVGATMRLHSLAVHPGARGLGLGNGLLDFARARALATGHRRLTLEADAERPELSAWYERRGFRRSRRLPDYYGKGHDAWRLGLALESAAPA